MRMTKSSKTNKTAGTVLPLPFLFKVVETWRVLEDEGYLLSLLFDGLGPALRTFFRLPLPFGVLVTLPASACAPLLGNPLTLDPPRDAAASFAPAAAASVLAPSNSGTFL